MQFCLFVFGNGSAFWPLEVTWQPLNVLFFKKVITNLKHLANEFLENYMRYLRGVFEKFTAIGLNCLCKPLLLWCECIYSFSTFGSFNLIFFNTSILSYRWFKEGWMALLISIVLGRPTRKDLDKQMVNTGWVRNVNGLSLIFNSSMGS